MNFLMRKSLQSAVVVAAIAAHTLAAAEYGLGVDCSGSMEGAKFQAAVEGAMLFVALLDEGDVVQLVAFNEQASTAQFKIDAELGRPAAMQWLRRLRVGGGTNYLAAIDALRNDLQAVIFVSDGAHDGAPEPVLERVRSKFAGKTRLHTIAVDTGLDSPAERLLIDMAAVTKGSFNRVEESEQLVKALIEAAVRLGAYRTYTPAGRDVLLPGSVDRAMVFAYDGTASISVRGGSAPTIFPHHAELPGEDVDLRIAKFIGPNQGIELKLLQPRSSQARLGDVIVSGLPRIALSTNATANGTAAGGEIQGTLTIRDDQNQVLDANLHPEVTGTVQVRNQTGDVFDEARATATPGDPRLHVTLKVPAEEGNIIIGATTTVKTGGLSFNGSEETVVPVVKPQLITASPSTLVEAATVGPFEVRLNLKSSGGAVTPHWTARFDSGDPSLKLVRALSGDGGLLLSFQGDKSGTFMGKIVAGADSEVPMLPVIIPCEFRLTDPPAGLDLPAARRVELGSTFAGGGRLTLPLSFPSRDDHPIEYRLEVRDLASANSVLTVSLDAATMRPTKDRAAQTQVSIDVGKATLGHYEGKVIARCDALPNRTWETTLALDVTEPLNVDPIDLGAVEVGGTVGGKLTLHNAGTVGSGVTIVSPAELTSEKLRSGEIELTFAQRSIVVVARGSSVVPFEMAVSPAVRLRGVVEGTARITRHGGSDLLAPIKLTIVEPGQGKPAYVAAPGSLMLTAKAGGVADFTLTLRPDANTSTADAVAGELEGFQLGDQRAAIVGDLTWPRGTKLSPGGSVELRGELLCPRRPGRYEGRLTIVGRAGRCLVPVTLEVR